MSFIKCRKHLPAICFSIVACTVLRAQAPQTCPGPVNGAFTACYYNNSTLSGNPALIRTDNQINFNWAGTTPGRAISSATFSAVWQGNFSLAQGTYIFTATASDGIRLYVDGQILINRWQDQAPSTTSASQTLAQGTHLVVVEYYENTGAGVVGVSWQNGLPDTQAPVISSFTATPSVVASGQPVTLSWSVSGATGTTIDNSVGDVWRQSSVTVFPSQSTTYTLTASNPGATSTAVTTVTVGAAPSPQQAPSTPTLLSAAAVSPNEVDLTWTASTDTQGIRGYQVFRNGVVTASVPGATLSWSDRTVSALSSYTYAVTAYDAAGLYSPASNSIQVTTPAVAQSPTQCPAPATDSFTGCYFNNTTLSGNPAFVRNDTKIQFYWGNLSPDNSLPPMNFSARWQGNFNFTAGNYTFTAIASDGVRLYVDGVLIIDQWHDQAPTTWTAPYTLSSGTHLITVEYYERTGQAAVQVSMQELAAQPVPPVISSFTAAPSSTAPGQPVTLQWTVSGATATSINGVGDVSGRASLTVYPTQTTTYTLTASGAGGNTTATATVTIQGAVDTQPPSTPQLLSATAAAPGTANLTWTASSDNVGVSGYQIVRNGSVIATVSASTLAWSDTNLTPGSVYTYAVRAFDAAGNYSAPSNAIQVVIPVPVSAPVISSFVATPASTTAGNLVALSWVATGATKLSLDQGIGDVTGSSSTTVAPNSTTTYTLSASNNSGTTTASVTVTITQVTDNQPPTTPVLLTPAVIGPTEVDLSWNPSTDNVGVAGYQVIRNGAVIGITPGTVTTYRDATVSANSTYSYTIKAFDSAGNYSAASNAMQVSTPAVSNISATWYGGCWQAATIYGVTGHFQAIDFAVTTPSPVALEGTLFFAPNCDPSNGTDNMNDNGMTINSTHMVQGFALHPDVIPSSAIYWFGARTSDGMCPPGAPCSGCVNYTKTTPSCDDLP